MASNTPYYDLSKDDGSIYYNNVPAKADEHNVQESDKRSVL